MKRSLLIVLFIGVGTFAQPLPTEGKNGTETVGSPSEQSTAVAESIAVQKPILSYPRSVPTYTQKYEPVDYSSPYPASTCHGHAPGYYGNPHHGCKVFHVCQEDGRLETFDCPPYTKFNQYLLVCDWPFKVDSNCDPIYKDEDYPPQSYNTAYPIDKSYLPSFLNLYPVSKPAYTVPEHQPSYPLVPIHNAYAKAQKTYSDKSYVPVAPVYESYGEKPYAPYKKPGYVRDYKTYVESVYEKLPYAEKPVQYEKPAYDAYTVEKSPVHVVYPVVKPIYPVEKVAYGIYETPKRDYIEKPVYRSHKPVYKVPLEKPVKEEYASYAPEKTVVLPLYPRDTYEPNYPVHHNAHAYKEDKPYVEPIVKPVSYDKNYPSPAAYPEKPYVPEQHPVPAPVYADKYPESTYPVDKSYNAYPEKAYDRIYTSPEPTYEKYPITIPEKPYEIKPVVKYIAPAKLPVYSAPLYEQKTYPAAEYKLPVYGPENVYDVKMYEKYLKYPIASYAPVKNYVDYAVDPVEYAATPYVNHRSRLAALLKNH